MKKVVVFGGSGGLGSKLVPLLEQHYEVTALSSKDIDVRNFEAVQSFFSANSFDIVLNLSGVNANFLMHKIKSSDQSAIDNTLDVNIKGTINILSAALPGMRERGYGRIVLFSSILANAPVVGTGIYSGCKGFLDSITKTTALENAGKGITCNSLQLGYFDAGLLYEIPEEFREHIRQQIPQKRWGTIDELFNVVNMLVETPYLTGVNLPVNGGKDF